MTRPRLLPALLVVFAVIVRSPLEGEDQDHQHDARVHGDLRHFQKRHRVFSFPSPFSTGAMSRRYSNGSVFTILASRVAEDVGVRPVVEPELQLLEVPPCGHPAVTEELGGPIDDYFQASAAGMPLLICAANPGSGMSAPSRALV